MDGELAALKAAVARKETLIANALRAQTAMTETKGLHMDSSIEPSLPPVMVDEGLIERVLQTPAVGNDLSAVPR